MILIKAVEGLGTGTPPLKRFFGSGKNRVKGKLRYRRSILVLKWGNGTFELPKSTLFEQKFATYLSSQSITFKPKQLHFLN
jgi:hypothetical protein